VSRVKKRHEVSRWKHETFKHGMGSMRSPPKDKHRQGRHEGPHATSSMKRFSSNEEEPLVNL